MGADAEAADLADVLLMVLDADHSDDVSRQNFGDPEMVSFGAHVGGVDVIDVEAGVVLGELAAEEAIEVELGAGGQIRLLESADLEAG